MYEMLLRSTGLDDFSIVQIFSFTVLCGFILCQRLDGGIAMAFACIGLFAAALIANVVGRSYGFGVTYNKDIDGILLTTIGLIGGALLSVLLMLLSSKLVNTVGKSAHDLREQNMAEEEARRAALSAKA